MLIDFLPAGVKFRFLDRLTLNFRELNENPDFKKL